MTLLLFMMRLMKHLQHDVRRKVMMKKVLLVGVSCVACSNVLTKKEANEKLDVFE